MSPALSAVEGVFAMACPACFSQVAEGSPLVDAALLGVMALLAVTIGVLAAFAMFIRHLMKLSANQEETS